MSSSYQLKKNEKFGFLQVHPTPTKEEIVSYYKQEFYSSNYGQVNNSSLEYEEKDRVFNEIKRGHLYTLLSKTIKKNDLSGLHLFDIGCGFGYMLSYFKAKGLICTGCEPSGEAVKHAQANGLDVLSIEEMGLNELNLSSSADIVTLMNVLEHVAEPIEMIRTIRDKFITSNGILYIEVPNDFSHFQMAAQKTLNLPEWWVSPPAHLNYFNKDTLAALLQGCGFEVVRYHASFPIEMFLLFGENYIEDKSLGRSCHEKRVAFEKALCEYGSEENLLQMYQAFAKLGIGRTIGIFARAI